MCGASQRQLPLPLRPRPLGSSLLERGECIRAPGTQAREARLRLQGHHQLCLSWAPGEEGTALFLACRTRPGGLGRALWGQGSGHPEAERRRAEVTARKPWAAAGGRRGRSGIRGTPEPLQCILPPESSPRATQGGPGRAPRPGSGLRTRGPASRRPRPGRAPSSMWQEFSPHYPESLSAAAQPS